MVRPTWCAVPDVHQQRRQAIHPEGALQAVRQRRRGGRPHDDDEKDQVYAVVEQPIQSGKSGRFTLKAGRKACSRCRCRSLAADKQIEVKVFEWDLTAPTTYRNGQVAAAVRAHPGGHNRRRTASYRVALDIA